GVSRGLIWAALLVLLAGLGGAGWWGVMRWSHHLASPSPDDATEERRADAVSLLQQARERSQAGDWATATQLYREAEQLMPDNAGLQRLRRSVEGRAQDQVKAAQATLLAGWLEKARAALAAQRFQDAAAAASAVLQ